MSTDHTTSRRAVLAGALGMGGLATLAGELPAAAAAVPIHPDSDFFLAINGIPGEATDSKHPGAIPLLTWAFGVTSSMSPLRSGGGAAVGKSSPTDFTFVAAMSKASPKLYQYVCLGKHVTQAVLTARKRSDEQRRDYLKVTFQDVLVTSYQVAPGDDDAYPLDVVHLDYAKITYSYTAQSANGSLLPAVVFGFDFAKNKPI